MGSQSQSYRAFELLHHLGDELLGVEGEHETVDAWVVRKEKSATILVTNHAMPRHPIHTELTNLRIAGARNPASSTSRESTRIMPMRDSCGKQWANRIT